MPYNAELFQNKLVTYSAPTLVHLKVGSLFCISKEDFPNHDECLDYFNDLFVASGLKICILKTCQTRLMIYIYHEDKLERLLKDDAIMAFMSTYGYQYNKADEALEALKLRLRSDTFPHEIGIFLGYPLYDVQFFISYPHHQKCIGCWKVYGNQKNAQKKFDRFECVKNDIYRRLSDGQTIIDVLSS